MLELQLTKVSIPTILPQISKPWCPKLLANLNDEYDLKVAKLKDEFVFHAHPDTDELFYILSGTLIIRLREPGNESRQDLADIILNEGDVFVVPKGVRHCPATKNGEEVVVLLLEKVGTVNTGDADTAEGLTNEIEDFRRID